VSFIKDFTVSSIQYVAVKFNRNSKALDHSDKPCVLGRFLSGGCRDYTCVDCEGYTIDKNRRFPILIRKSKILYGAMFDIADVTGNSALEHIFNLPFTASLHWRLLFKRYINNHTNAAMCSHNILVSIATLR